MTARIFVLVLTLFLAVLPSIGYSKGPVPVFATKVEEKMIADEIEALGTVRAKESVDLASTVTELVTRVNFEDGQRVQKGDVLVEMDAAEEQALMAEELSRIKEAQRQVKRLQPLVARGAASNSVLDEQQLELQTARARLAAIASRTQQRKIIAPFAGVLGLRNISVGTLLQPGGLITTLDDDSMMKLDFSVPSLFIPVLKRNAEIVAYTKAWPKQQFVGKVLSINSRVDPVTRSIAVRAIIENTERKLRPGLLMRVQLNKNPRVTTVIPEEALVIQGNEHAVMLITKQNGKSIIKRQLVSLGIRRKGEAEILSGLKADQLIVTHGTLRVRSGTEVVVKAVETNNETLTGLLGQQPPTGE